MSIRLRIKFKFGAISNFLYNFSLPGFLEGKAARVVATCLLVLFGVLYVVETNILATGGYKIHSLEQQVANLNNELQSISSEIAEAESMTTIQKRLVEVSMVPASDVKFVTTIVETTVAKR